MYEHFDKTKYRYVNEIPYEIHVNLCILLDIDNEWEKLARIMGYKSLDIIEIGQKARRNITSPTKQLFTTWGQLNHRVGELFVYLYRMEHVPALKCLLPILEGKYHKHFRKLCPNDKDIDFSVVHEHKKLRLSTDEHGSEISNPVTLIKQDSSPKETKENDQETKEIDLYAKIMKNVSAIPSIKYEELEEATNGWSVTNKLGSGGFAEVFKGEWKQFTVAVKRLRAVESRDKELNRELSLNQFRHDNIVPLYGYSYGGREACLVYQLMLGGTLEQRLRSKTMQAPLTWAQRYRIAHGVARGIQFLHSMTKTPLIHGDIKPANILLDENLTPKIGDFGLSRQDTEESNRTHIKVSRLYGTRLYLPDEYLRSGILSPATDVFSFGIVMLEIATGLRAMDHRRPVQVQRLTDLMVAAEKKVDTARFEDRQLRKISNPALCREFISIGIHCIKKDRHERPTMLEVYKQLHAMATLSK